MRRWRDLNRRKKQTVEDVHVPTRNDEYLLYQTLIGMLPNEILDDSAWYQFVTRIEKYMLKAAREAKEYTSWANENPEY